jgi:hypothetical protein
VNTIISGNTPTDCGANTSKDNGGNLDSDGTCKLTKPTSISKGIANLGPLQNNGGPTQTEALLLGSQAINLGLGATCLTLVGPDGVTHDTDQRGVARGNSAGRPACDSGAWDSGGLFTLLGTVLLSTFHERVGFVGTSRAGRQIAYINVTGPLSFKVVQPNITLCSGPCVGKPATPAPGTALFLLSGPLASGRGAAFAVGDVGQVLVTVQQVGTQVVVLRTEIRVLAPDGITVLQDEAQSAPFAFGTNVVAFTG